MNGASMAMSGGRSLRLDVSKGLDPEILKQLLAAAAGLMEEAEVAPEQRHSLAVVIEELCTNVLEHSGAAWIELAVVTGGQAACLSLSDNGKPFDPVHVIQARDFSKELGSDEGRNLGLYMLTRLTQSLRYLREEHGVNRVTLQLAAPTGR